MLLVELRIISGIVRTDKVGVGTAVGKAAANNLFYLTLVKVNAGAKRGQGTNSE